MALFFVDPNRMLIYFTSLYYRKRILLTGNRAVFYVHYLELWKTWALESGRLASNLSFTA